MELNDWHEKQEHLKRVRQGTEKHSPILTVLFARNNERPCFRLRCRWCGDALPLPDKGHAHFISHDYVRSKYGSIEAAIHEAVDEYSFTSEIFTKLRK